MTINEHPVEWYLDKIRRGEPFSLGHYGDGEWQAIFNHVFDDRFTENCEGTKYTTELSQKLAESLKYPELGFYFATPDTFIKNSIFKRYADLIDRTQQKLGVHIEFVEKQVWNTAMWKGELYPIIEEFRKHNVCIVSNKALRALTFLNYDHYIEIDYPNCFYQLEETTKQILEYGKEGIYLFACGIPAALFVQAVHGKIPNSWFLDLGSIWDGFAGIGGQRPTRREFYLHPETWVEWVNKNLKDIEWPRTIPKIHWHGMGSLDINSNLTDPSPTTGTGA